MFTHKGIKYRVGTQEDVPGILLFINNFRHENKLVAQFGYDMLKSAEILKRLMKNDRGAVLLAEDVDIIVGIIILGKMTLWWAEKEFFTDLVFYVNPTYRKDYDIQTKLLNFTKDFATQVQMPVMIDVFNDEDVLDLKERYLRIKGFKSVGFRVMFTPPPLT
jgi:hypothetical protein